MHGGSVDGSTTYMRILHHTTAAVAKGKYIGTRKTATITERVNHIRRRRRSPRAVRVQALTPVPAAAPSETRAAVDGKPRSESDADVGLLPTSGASGAASANPPGDGGDSSGDTAAPRRRPAAGPAAAPAAPPAAAPAAAPSAAAAAAGPAAAPAAAPAAHRRRCRSVSAWRRRIRLERGSTLPRWVQCDGCDKAHWGLPSRRIFAVGVPKLGHIPASTWTSRTTM